MSKKEVTSVTIEVPVENARGFDITLEHYMKDGLIHSVSWNHTRREVD